MGKGAVELLHHLGADFTRPALEVGCGAGALSYGLAQYSKYPRLILSDPSARFLEITRMQIEEVNFCHPPDFAVMLAEHVSLFPAESLSLVLTRYTLHHIWDLDSFFAECHRALVPGGVLLFEEPHASFFTHAAAMVQFMAPLIKNDKPELPDKILRQMNTFLRTIENFVREDIDKSSQEDKHLFGTEAILDLAEKHGFRFRFVLNRNLASFANTGQATTTPCLSHGTYDFYDALRYYMVEIMRFGQSFGTVLDATLKTYCENFNMMFKGTIPPPNILIGACLKMNPGNC
jgi:ubiquinone/menaquinone biosynthesis C-methylase UbiE